MQANVGEGFVEVPPGQVHLDQEGTLTIAADATATAATAKTITADVSQLAAALQTAAVHSAVAQARLRAQGVVTEGVPGPVRANSALLRRQQTRKRVAKEVAATTKTVGKSDGGSAPAQSATDELDAYLQQYGD